MFRFQITELGLLWNPQLVPKIGKYMVKYAFLSAVINGQQTFEIRMNAKVWYSLVCITMQPVGSLEILSQALACLCQ